METLKPIFRATVAGGRNGYTEASVSSAKAYPSVPKPLTELPEHLFAAPDRRVASDPDLSRILVLLRGELAKLTAEWAHPARGKKRTVSISLCGGATKARRLRRWISQMS